MTPNLQDQEQQNLDVKKDLVQNAELQDVKTVQQTENTQTQPGQPIKVKLYIVDEQQNSVTFKCKPTNKLSKLFTTYADNRGTSVNEIRFFYNGKKLNGDMTVADAGLTDECTINVLRQQVGGF